MKTSFDLPEPLLREAQELAARQGTTTKSIVVQALSRFLGDQKSNERFSLRDASVPGDGLSPEFTEASWSDLRAALYDPS